MNSEQILILNDVNFSLKNAPILKNITFAIDRGDFVSIVGPNGAGKTTLFKLLLGIMKPNSGDITFVNGMKNKHIGYVSQAKTMDKKFPATAIELVCTGIFSKWQFSINKKYKEQAIDILKKINAEHLAYKQVSELSGGELQRIYLARAIIRNPKILLLDEPATGIDLVCEKDVTGIIKQLNEEHKTTIIMITHDWTSAYQHSKKILLLNKKILYFGDAKSAFTDSNIALTFGTDDANLEHRHDVQFGVKNV